MSKYPYDLLLNRSDALKDYRVQLKLSTATRRRRGQVHQSGIVQLAKALTCAWAKDNIQVNAVLPGWIDPALTRQARRDIAGLEER
jgi:hypothetical protein